MNSDHRDNIGTHPAYSQDPETRLRARAEAAQRNKARADADYTTARNNLRVFLEARDRISATMPDEFPVGYAIHLAAEHVDEQQESKGAEVPC